MKIRTPIKAALGICLALVISAGYGGLCSSSSSSSGSSESKSLFYKYTKEVTPEFAPSESVGLLDKLFGVSNAYAAMEWGPGHPVYNIFFRAARI